MPNENKNNSAYKKSSRKRLNKQYAKRIAAKKKIELAAAQEALRKQQLAIKAKPVDLRAAGVGREEQETARNIAIAAQKGPEAGGGYGSLGMQSGADADLGIAQSQAETAKQVLAASQVGEKAAKADIMEANAPERAAATAKSDANYAAQIEEAKSNGMMIGNMPVVIKDGKLRYDVDKIGASMKMTPDQIAAAKGVGFIGREVSDTGKKIDDLVGGQRNVNEGQRKAAWDRSMAKLQGVEAAMINNLSVLDPTRVTVDLTKEDHLLNLGKPGFMQDINPNDWKSQLNKNQGPTGVGKYAGPALKAGVGAMLTVASAGAAAPWFAAPLVAGGYSTLTGVTEDQKSLMDMAKNFGVGAVKQLITQGVSGAVGAEGVADAAGTGIKGAMSGVGQNLAVAGTEALGGIASNVAEGLIREGEVDLGSALKSGLMAGGTSFIKETASPFVQSLKEKAGGALGIDVEPAPADTFTGEGGFVEGLKGGLSGLTGAFTMGDEADVLGAATEDVDQVAPSALEVGASPGDVATDQSLESGITPIINSSKQDIARLSGTDLGYGPGALGGQASGLDMKQAPTGPEGIISQEPNMASIPTPEEVTGGATMISQLPNIPTPEELTGVPEIAQLPDIPTPYNVTGGAAPMGAAEAEFESAQGRFGGLQGMEQTIVPGMTITPDVPMYDLNTGGIAEQPTPQELEFEKAQEQFGGQQGMEAGATETAEIAGNVPLYDLDIGGIALPKQLQQAYGMEALAPVALAGLQGGLGSFMDNGGRNGGGTSRQGTAVGGDPFTQGTVDAESQLQIRGANIDPRKSFGFTYFNPNVAEGTMEPIRKKRGFRSMFDNGLTGFDFSTANDDEMRRYGFGI